MKSADQILAVFMERRKFYAPLHNAMAQIAAVYDGTAVVDLPDMARADQSAVPNLLAQGVDQMAGRIASVIPNVSFVSENPGKRDADRRAQTQRHAVMGWWESDRLPMKMKNRARHLIAYGMAPVSIRFDAKRNLPTWEVRKPMECFPSLDRIPGTVQPTDVIFAYQRSVGWLRAKGYGAAVAQIAGRYDMGNDEMLLMLEYVDPEGCVLAIAGHSDPNAYMLGWSQYAASMASTMRAVPVEAYETDGIMVASVPTRLTLNRPGGQFDAMTGMYYSQSKLMALELLAVEKGIFPDVYLESRQGEVARFIDGPYDGRSGNINIVAGGTIREQQNVPGYMTPQTIDRLERSQRVTAGIPAEFGGESGSNIRTGRRGDAVLSAVIDFPVSEAQEVMAYGLIDEDKAAIGLAKKFAGDATVTVFVGGGNSRRPVTYVANKVFTNDEHTVAYPVVGTDMNSLMVGIGQRIGMGIMSKETGAWLDPFIDDVEAEHDRIIAEGLEQALVDGFQQQAASGQIPPLTIAKVMALVRQDKMELAEAITRVTADALAAQHEQQQAQMSMQPPAGPPTPEQANAGPAAAAMAGGGSPIPGASQGQQDLGSLLATLRTPLRGVANRVGTTDQAGRVAV